MLGRRLFVEYSIISPTVEDQCQRLIKMHKYDLCSALFLLPMHRTLDLQDNFLIMMH